MIKHLPGAAVSAVIICGVACADEFHYNNILIGDRAAGMGGAYTAVSDDPSGLYYNPAGIVYSTGRNLSASVNAFHVSERTYKSALGPGLDWKRTSSSLLPNFFGIVQPLGKVWVGFSYAVPDSNNEDQDQSFTYSYPWNSGTTPKDSTHVINFNNKNDTTLFGPSVAMPLRDDLSLGATLYVHRRSTEAILNQPVQSLDGTSYRWMNAYQETEEWGVRPVVGVMWSPAERVSFGLSLARTFVLDSEVLVQQTVATSEGATPFVTTNSTIATTGDKRRYPYQVVLGGAFFPTPALLVSADLSFYSAYDYSFLGRRTSRESVVNGAVGAEWFLNKEWAVRGGVFTDLASTPPTGDATPAAPDVSEYEHIDLYGGALSLSRFSRNSSITLGGSYKYGSGSHNVTGSRFTIDQVKDATLSSWTLFVSSSYSF